MSKLDGVGKRAHVRYVALTIGLVFVILWLRPLSSSLWLDELGTWWVVKDGLGDALTRALEYQGQSPAYNVLAWSTGQVTGPNEALLRLPSLVASVASLALFHRLITRLVDREAALFATLGFVGMAGIAFAATNFRPYAIALFFLVTSMFLLVRWLDDDQMLDVVLYVVATALVIWGHYLFTLALIAQVAYAAVRIRSGSTSVRTRSLVIAWVAALLLVLPLAGQLASLWARRGVLSIPYDATFEEFLTATFKSSFIGALLLGGALAWLLGRFTVLFVPGRPGTAALLWTWLLVPTWSLLLISVFTPLDFYSPRYYLSAAPAGAALFGWAVRCVDRAEARRTIGIAYAILAILMAASPMKSAEDWRGLAEAERRLADEDTLVLMLPAFIESAQLEWLTDPERRSYLLAPASFYALEGRLEHLPFFPDRSGLTYLDALLVEELPGADEILLVSRPGLGKVAYRAWLDGRLGKEGWTSRLAGQFGSIELVEFTRGEGALPPS